MLAEVGVSLMSCGCGEVGVWAVVGGREKRGVVSGREGKGRILWQVCLCDRCYNAVVCSVADSAEEVGALFSVTVLLAVHRTPPSLLQMLTVRLEESDYSSAWVVSQQVRSERRTSTPTSTVS